MFKTSFWKEEVPKWYGVSEPISLDFPSEEELVRTRTLMDNLKSLNLFQSHLEVEHRERVLRNVESLFKQWVTETCLAKNSPYAELVGGRVVPFGSFALGVHTKGADVDLLCVGPAMIARSLFFSSFVEKLKTHNAIRIVQVIEDGYVPVIKLTFDGIDIDMVYAKMSKTEITDNLDLMDVKHLEFMDITSVRSLQGFRVTQEIISLVPNVFTFRVVLATIKHWAKCRNIYSNKMGFLGGVSWGILVARVCQLYPYATAATVVTKFFKVFSLHQWPIPVTLNRPEQHGFNFPTWNPRENVSDRFHRMPIITPLYPHQNSAFNVTSSTLRIVMEEIVRGNSLMEEMNGSKAVWKKLFERTSFFQEYKHYIVLGANALGDPQQQVWAGFVESKIRQLVAILETNADISLACPCLQSFGGKGGCNTLWLVGIKFKSSNKYVNLSLDLDNFVRAVYAHTGKVWAEGMCLSAACADHKTVNMLLQTEETKELAQTRSGVKKRKGSAAENEKSAKKLRAESFTDLFSAPPVAPCIFF